MDKAIAEALAKNPPPRRRRTTSLSRLRTAGLDIDLKKVTIPVLAINGEFDRRYSGTQRIWRELHDFTNLVLAGKSHLTAIAYPYIPKEYEASLVRFMAANDPK